MFGATGANGVGKASTDRVPVLCLTAIAALCSAVALTGWVFAVPELRGLGLARYPIAPLTAVGYLFLSAGFWATLDRPRIAPWLIAVPLAITAIVVIEVVANIPVGIDRILFAREIAAHSAVHPGRPSANTVATFALIGSGLLLSARTRARGRVPELPNLLAAAAFSFGIYALIGLASLSAIHPDAFRPLTSAPSAIATIALSLAFLYWRRDLGWLALIKDARIHHSLIALGIPLLVVLPTVPFLVEHFAVTPGGLPPFTTELLAVISNVAVISLVLRLAVRRIARQQDALEDVTRALDLAAIVLSTSDGTIIHWSRGCEALYGWTAAEAVGKQKYALLRSRDDGTPFVSAAGERQLREQRRDGTELRVLEEAQLLERPGRESIRVLKMLDVSDRVRANEALRESEARLANATAALRLGISEWDVASGAIQWSPGSEQRLGFEPGYISTIDEWTALVFPEDVAGVMATIQGAAAQHLESITYRYRLRLADQSTRLIEGSGRCVYDDAGALKAVIGANVDATARGEREAQRQLESIIATVPDATIVITAQGIVRSFSTAAEQMFGYRAEDVIGKNVKLLMPRSYASGHDHAIERYFDTGERKVIGIARQLTARRADGTFFPIELNVGETWLGEERIFTGVIRDVTERIEAERRLSELNDELAHLARQNVMSEVAADLAHELNQPLSATSNYLATARFLIEAGADGPRIAELLRLGEEQTVRCGEIIRRLRDFVAKSEAEMRIESLGHIVRDSIALVLFGSTRFEIEINTAIDPGADGIFADRIQIQQVLVNLIRNAVEAVRTQPILHRRIDIHGRLRSYDTVEVSVGDSGPGLPEAMVRGNLSRFDSSKGADAMGIGLSISRRIVQAHGGALVGANKAEGGALFRFELAAAGEAEEC